MQRTAHASLVADILNLVAGRNLAPRAAAPQPPLEALSDSEIRVLRYLPTNVPAPETANELYVSLNTVKTHTRQLCAKLDTHTWADTVDRALGLLAPSPHQRQVTPAR
jgi:LuxR family maltose regulon positive regulatory protein